MGEMVQHGEMRQQLAASYQDIKAASEATAAAVAAQGGIPGLGQIAQKMAQDCVLAAINAMAAAVKSYVVHGAFTSCQYGSRPARLIVPMSHGVYLRGKAQLNKNDFLPNINVTPMGVCIAGYANICEQQEQAKNEKKSFSFSFISDSEKEASKEELINKATSSATLCTYFPLTPWLETKEDVFVDGVEALLSTSYLICMKGGKVKITNDGQYS